MTSPTTPPRDTRSDDAMSMQPRPTPLVTYVVVAMIVIGTLLRFWSRSDLWLDEALSVNIAQTGWGGIPDALYRDGHPPLYYVLLWLWTLIGGDSNWWVRALSGVIYSLSLPLFYLAGRQWADRQARTSTSGFTPNPHLSGLVTLGVASISAYGIRFGSETRMYSLVILLTMVAYLVFSRALWDEPQQSKFSLQSWKFIVAGALSSTALLWTHYWSMWLYGAFMLLLVWRWFRQSASRGTTTAAGIALVLGGVLFLPWAPTLLHQAGHTGTPWGEPASAVGVALDTLTSFAGDPLTSYPVFALILLALFGAFVATRGSSTKDPDAASGEPLLVIRTTVQPGIRIQGLLVVLTLAIGWAASIAGGSTYHYRYSSVVFFLIVMIVAAGLQMLWRQSVLIMALVVLMLLSMNAARIEIAFLRTQAGDVAAEIEARFEPGDVVISCPDQVAVSTQRAIEQNGVIDTTLIPYPTAGDPRFVDWTDYRDRNEAADPQGFWDGLPASVHEAPSIFFVHAGGYETFEASCAQLGAIIGQNRQRTLPVERGDMYESMDLFVYQLPE